MILILQNWGDVPINEEKQENTPPAHIQLGLLHQSKQFGSTGSKKAGEPVRGLMDWIVPGYAQTRWMSRRLSAMPWCRIGIGKFVWISLPCHPRHSNHKGEDIVWLHL